jgi:hypothetical protein
MAAVVTAGTSMSTERFCPDCGYFLDQPDAPCRRCEVDDGMMRAVVCSLLDAPTFVAAVDTGWEAKQLANRLRETNAFTRVDIVMMHTPESLYEKAALTAAIVADLAAEAMCLEKARLDGAIPAADIPTDNTCLVCGRRVPRGLTLGLCGLCASGTRH